jgi:hypothetical protein
LLAAWPIALSARGLLKPSAGSVETPLARYGDKSLASALGLEDRGIEFRGSALKNEVTLHVTLWRESYKLHVFCGNAGKYFSVR